MQRTRGDESDLVGGLRQTLQGPRRWQVGEPVWTTVVQGFGSCFWKD